MGADVLARPWGGSWSSPEAKERSITAMQRANNDSLNWRRGRLNIPEHCPRLIRLVFQILNEEKATITEVSKRAGLSQRTISRWRRNTPNITDWEAFLNAMGYEVVVRRKGEK